jgi:Cys-tRNA(Pro) deacylase
MHHEHNANKPEIILDKEPVKRVQKIISKFDNNLSILVLNNTARTAKDAANSLNCDVGAIVKSLLFKVEDFFLICLVAGDKRCSLKKLKKILNKRDISMANPNEVKENTGFSIGAVSPVGHIKKLNILIDSSFNRFKNVFAAAGHPNCIFKINYNELIKLTNGSESDISE